MYELTIETKFSAAHQLRGYQGRCEKLHGHNWKVKVSVVSEVLNDIGLVMDFKDLKDATNEFLAQLEHSFVNDVFPFTEINPSSENIAKWIYDGLSKKLNTDYLSVSMVTVYESDNACASYYE
ncbi:MAG: 6-carboxytetrahydropterin synthase QueD [Nitrospirae bacterium]|nr:6-carboxytetrahydropterin synthase QueD [Nitrospirota bacterium]